MLPCILYYSILIVLGIARKINKNKQKSTKNNHKDFLLKYLLKNGFTSKANGGGACLP